MAQKLRLPALMSLLINHNMILRNKIRKKKIENGDKKNMILVL